jgi:hypothetical protein
MSLTFSPDIRAMPILLLPATLKAFFVCVYQRRAAEPPRIAKDPYVVSASRGPGVEKMI